MAIIENEVESSLRYFAQALSETEWMAIRYARAPLFYRELFPEYEAHPEYQKMLRDVGLDDESIAKLKIPPLPF